MQTDFHKYFLNEYTLSPQFQFILCPYQPKTKLPKHRECVLALGLRWKAFQMFDSGDANSRYSENLY